MTTNPLRDLRAPPPTRPRCQLLELLDVVRLVEGSYQAIFALAYGAGPEISAILAGTETDVDYTVRTVRARGTKAWNRDRLA